MVDFVLLACSSEVWRRMLIAGEIIQGERGNVARGTGNALEYLCYEREKTIGQKLEGPRSADF